MITSSADGRGAGTAEQLFHELVGLPPGEREAYLERVCPADHEAALRAEVLELLQGHEEAGGFLPYETVTGPLFRRPADLLPESPGDQIGPYKLMEQIGEGGFGVVWVAEQEKPVRRRVALKVLKPGMDTKQVVARFEQERQALALMDHPNIARVLDAGATPHGRPFFVMELVKGLKITEYCDQAQLPTGDRLRLFIAVCQAVQHAHQKGIIHRDIKPSNILVTQHDGVPVPKVIDFGVAKATQQQRLTDLTLYTQFEQIVGTPLYMSPEQAEMSGLDIDTRSDIYSLGVLLYELLTGRTPFDPATLMKRGLEEIRRAVREQEPQKPSTFVSTLALDLRTDLARHRQTDSARLVGQIRGDLDWIVMKALEKDRNRRYETATGFALDIQRHLGNEPVQARPPSVGYRFRRMVRRNKAVFMAGTAIFAALLTGLGVSTWMFFQEKQARKKEEHARQRAVAAETAQNEERKKAESEAGKSRQVTKFLIEMLESVGPSVALGRDTTMLREILDNTGERIDDVSKDQPEAGAELCSIMGEVYVALGEYEKASVMHGEALAIRKKLPGGENLQVAASMNDMACVLQHQGKPAEAETMHREVLAIYRRLHGNEHADVANALTNLGICFRVQGKLDEAESMQREALAMQRRLSGYEHPDVATALNNLGTVLENQGKLTEAGAAHREAIAMQRKLLGDSNPNIVHSLTNLGNVLLGLKKLDEAEAAQREAVALQRKLSGNEHPMVALALGNLANVIEQQKKPADAEPLYREALAMQRKWLGNEHHHVAVSLSNLAGVLENQDKQDEAESSYREALAIRRKLFGDTHPDVASSLHSVALMLNRQGRNDEAEPFMREALTINRQLLPTDHSTLALLIGHLGIILEAQRKYPDAEIQYREALTISRKLRGPGSAGISQWHLRLDGVLEKQGKLADLETSLREALEEARQLEPPNPLRVESQSYNFAERLYRQGKYAAAEPLLREVIASMQVRLGPGNNKDLPPKARLARLLGDWAWTDHLAKSDMANPKSRFVARVREAEQLMRQTLEAQLQANRDARESTEYSSRLGGVLSVAAAVDPSLTGEERAAKFSEAESLLLEANQRMQHHTDFDNRFKRDSLARLVRLYEAWGKPDKAAEWREKLAAFDESGAEKDGGDHAEAPTP